MSVCFCVLAIMTQCPNAKSQPQLNVWYTSRLPGFGREGGRKGGTEGGREGGREGGKEGGR